MALNSEIMEQFIEIKRHRINLKEELEKSKSQGIYDILGNLYDDPIHFIYEIIQNADDEDATQIEINVLDDRVEIHHNGNQFKIKDIESICAIGNSEKKLKIGRFGIGFKSVFAVTDRPEIYSNGFNFAIENFIVPVLINSNNIYEEVENETYILLPFNNRVDNIVNKICLKVQSFNFREFIFLNNILRITIKHKNVNIFTFSKELVETDIENCIRMIINEDVKYLSFTDTKNKFLKVAYRLEDGKKKGEFIIPEYDDLDKTTNLNVFFPVKYNTKLDFLIQGNFLISKDRKNINFDLGDNKKMLSDLLDLVISSILTITSSKNKSLNFYHIIPMKKIQSGEENLIINELVDKVYNMLNYRPVWLTDRNEYCTKDKILTTDQRKIKGLFSPLDIYGKYDYYWVNDILENGEKTKLLLEEYEVKKIAHIDIKKMLIKDPLFIKSKDKEWLIKFYKYILSEKQLTKEYGNLPLIKTSTGEFVPIFNNEEFNVFRDIDKNMKIGTIQNNEINILAREFIEPLSDTLQKTDAIPTFNGYNLIANILETNMKTDEGSLLLTKYFEVLNRILFYYKIIRSNEILTKTHNLLNKRLPIAGCINLKKYMLHNDTTEYYLNNSDPENYINIYWSDENSIKLYQNKKIKNENVLKSFSFNNNSKNEKHFIINKQLYNKNLEDGNYNIFESILDKINIQENIFLITEITNVIQYSFELMINKKSFNDRLRPSDNSNYSRIYNPSILFINNILDNITDANSHYLWKLIYEFFVKINFQVEGYYKFWYGASNLTTVKTKLEIVEKLKTSKWIYDKYGNIKSPESLSYLDLKESNYYLGEDEKSRLNYKRMCRILDISIEEKLSKNERIVYEIADTFSIEQLEKLRDYITNKINLK